MNHRRFLLHNPWMPLAVLILGDLLMVADVLPRTTSFALAFVALIAVSRLSLPKAVFFTVASIPLSPALPIPGFDTFALWRLIVFALGLRVLFSHRELLKTTISGHSLRKSLLSHEWIGLLLFLLAALSLTQALDPVAGYRKLIFLGNAVLLYLTFRWLFGHDPQVIISAIKGLLVALATLLAFGVTQYVSVFFVSLYDFWQGWALDAIPVLYGDELGIVLSQSNTWFSYYEGSLPTLRMFSLLPDSHSFGILMLMGFLLTLGVSLPATHSPKTSWRWRALLIAFGSAIFFNGSRGIWLMAVPTALVALVLAWLWKKQEKPNLVVQGRSILAAFGILALLFPLTSLITSRMHGAGIDDAQTTLAFQRAKSILDIEETSNKGRLGIWKANLESVREHPLLGVGFGNAAVALNENVDATRRGASAHNLYLDFAVETGIFGGALLLALFVTLLWQFLLPLLRANVTAVHASTMLAFSLTVVWIGLYNLFDVVLLNDRALLIFLTLIALTTTKANEKHMRAINLRCLNS